MNNTSTIKVFITDNHPVVVEGLKAVLCDRASFRIVGCASSAEEMFSRLPEVRPHVLLLDLNLPGSDYLANIAWVKGNLPWVKILAFSGYHVPDLIRNLRQEGVAGYVNKSATPEQICTAVEDGFSGIEVLIERDMAQAAAPSSVEHYDTFRKRLSLSRREQEILALISRGLSSQRIGKTLFISKYTVETHRKNILRKLDFNTSTELVKFAVQHGLV